MAIADRLHDEIDREEELSDRARQVVADVRDKATAIAKNITTIDEIFEAMAVLIEDELTELTTEAVRSGYAASLRRDG